MVRLAYFVSHPIQYQAPLLRLLAAEPDIQLKVFFYSDFSLRAYQDPGFGQSVQWDVPLTEGYDHHFLKCWGADQPTGTFRQAIALDIYDQLKQGQFEAIWVHGWSQICSLQAILAANRLDIPVMIRGDSNGLDESKKWKSWLKAKFYRWLFSRISSFLCVGTLNRKFYQTHGVSSSRLFSVPLAVDNYFFYNLGQQAKAQKHNLKISLQLEPSRPIILYAAKLVDFKRPGDLLAAYKLLSPDGIQEPDPYLLFVGEGAERAELEAIAAATGWNSIQFLGFRNQSQMPAIYNLCDVFVLPSSFEPWGLAINEVMNLGKALVVSDVVGCVPDLVIDQINGKIFKMGNVESLRDALNWAIANSENAGAKSLEMIKTWSFQTDIQGIKTSLGLI